MKRPAARPCRLAELLPPLYQCKVGKGLGFGERLVPKEGLGGTGTTRHDSCRILTNLEPESNMPGLGCQ